MASSPTAQVPDTAVDAAGLSVSTATRSASDPRPGQAWSPVSLAAAVPVHFHPTTAPGMGGASFLMLSSLRWTSATPSATDPGAYSAHTLDANPSWALINGATGQMSAVNSGFEIPMRTPNAGRTLTSAASRGNDNLWTLTDAVQGSNHVAVVQHWNYNTAINTLNLISEEVIPAGTNGSDVVVFSAGLQWSATTAPYMYAYGLGATTGHVYVARKAWARVGHVGTAAAPIDSQWEFGTSNGWSTVATDCKPVQTASGPLASSGPLSFAHYGMRRAQSGMSKGTSGYSFLATVAASGSARLAQVYESLGGRPWKSVGSPIALGTAGSTYLGGTLQFQGSVGPNPTMVDPANSATAIPYVYSTLPSAGKILQNWALLQVPRLS